MSSEDDISTRFEDAGDNSNKPPSWTDERKDEHIYYKCLDEQWKYNGEYLHVTCSKGDVDGENEDAHVTGKDDDNLNYNFYPHKKKKGGKKWRKKISRGSSKEGYKPTNKELRKAMNTFWENFQAGCDDCNDQNC